MPIYDADIMRAIIDIDEKADRALKRLAKEQGVSRAQVVREAIVHYLQERQAPSDASAFGLWKDRRVDGVEYQRQARKEWPA